MRTTIDIDDDVLAAVRSLAEQRGQSLGRALTELVRRALRPPSAAPSLRNGVPVFSPPSAGAVSDMDLVNRLRDEGE